MATALEVAAWMVERLDAIGRLEQKTVAQEIQTKFGGQHVYENKNGHLGIAQRVLCHFGVMTKSTAVWARVGRYWRTPPRSERVSNVSQHFRRSRGG